MSIHKYCLICPEGLHHSIMLSVVRLSGSLLQSLDVKTGLIVLFFVSVHQIKDELRRETLQLASKFSVVQSHEKLRFHPEI